MANSSSSNSKNELKGKRVKTCWIHALLVWALDPDDDHAEDGALPQMEVLYINVLVWSSFPLAPQQQTLLGGHLCNMDTPHTTVALYTQTAEGGELGISSFKTNPRITE